MSKSICIFQIPSFHNSQLAGNAWVVLIKTSCPGSPAMRIFLLNELALITSRYVPALSISSSLSLSFVRAYAIVLNGLVELPVLASLPFSEM